VNSVIGRDWLIHIRMLQNHTRNWENSTKLSNGTKRAGKCSKILV